MKNLRAVAYHLAQKIELKQVVQQLNLQEIKSDNSYVLLSAGEMSWVYLKNLGGVVYINCPDELRQNILELILGKRQSEKEHLSEEYIIEIEPDKVFHVDFSVIHLPKISDDIAHVIMLNLSQSATINDFYVQTERLLQITRSFSLQLDKTGRFKLSRRKVRQLIGQTLVLKNHISEGLFIYDTPDVAWYDKDLAALDEQMNKELELERRHRGLQLNLSVVKENIDVYRDILQHRHSSTLEWIIILLILFEVIQVFIE